MTQWVIVFVSIQRLQKEDASVSHCSPSTISPCWQQSPFGKWRNCFLWQRQSNRRCLWWVTWLYNLWAFDSRFPSLWPALGFDLHHKECQHNHGTEECKDRYCPSHVLVVTSRHYSYMGTGGVRGHNQYIFNHAKAKSLHLSIRTYTGFLFLFFLLWRYSLNTSLVIY